MPDAATLETLVKLAAAGTGGVCVLAIFWAGFMLMRMPADARREGHRSLRFFMSMCFGIALVSATTTVAAGYWDSKKIETLQSANQGKDQQLAEVDKLVADLAALIKAQDQRTQEVSVALQRLGQNQAAASPELARLSAELNPADQGLIRQRLLQIEGVAAKRVAPP